MTQPNSYGACSPTWEEIDEVIAKYTTVDMAKRLLELEHAQRNGPSSEEQRIKNLRWHLSALADQCERGNLVDDHGHEFKRNRVLIEARELLHSLDATRSEG